MVHYIHFFCWGGEQLDAREDDPSQCVQPLPMALVRASWNVLHHVFFGRPLLRLPSSGVHDIATFEGRCLGRCSMWPAKQNLRSATLSASFLEPVLSRTSSFVTWFRYVTCKI